MTKGTNTTSADSINKLSTCPLRTPIFPTPNLQWTLCHCQSVSATLCLFLFLFGFCKSYRRCKGPGGQILLQWLSLSWCPVVAVGHWLAFIVVLCIQTTATLFHRQIPSRLRPSKDLNLWNTTLLRLYITVDSVARLLPLLNRTSRIPFTRYFHIPSSLCFVVIWT